MANGPEDFDINAMNDRLSAGLPWDDPDATPTEDLSAWAETYRQHTGVAPDPEEVREYMDGRIRSMFETYQGSGIIAGGHFGKTEDEIDEQIVDSYSSAGRL